VTQPSQASCNTEPEINTPTETDFEIETHITNFEEEAVNTLNSLQNTTAEIMPTTIVQRKRRQVICKICGGNHYSKTMSKVANSNSVENSY
jgi:hypothetical protein